MELITSRKNGLVKRLRGLSNSKVRKESGNFLIEGTHLLVEALNNNLTLDAVFFTPQWRQKHEYILNLLPESLNINLVSQDVLQASITTVNPDGVAAICNVSSLPMVQKNCDFILALDRLQDPGNLGTLFRTALAAEVDLILLSSCVDPLSQKVLRSSVGAIFRMPFERVFSTGNDDVGTFLKKLQIAADNGFQIVGSFPPSESDIHRDLCPYWEINWTLKTVLILGNEGSGIHPTIKACCTHRVTLPHSIYVDSLNVSSAAVPLLLERHRAKITSKIHK